LVDVDHHGDAGDLRMLGRSDRERRDVVPAAGEERGDAGERTGLVLHQDREGLVLGGHDVIGRARRVSCARRASGVHCTHGVHDQMSLSHSGLMPCAIWISSLETPDGTIGQTIASALTLTSTTSVWSLFAIAWRRVSSLSPSRAERRPSQPYATASLPRSGWRREPWPVCRSVIECRWS